MGLAPATCCRDLSQGLVPSYVRVPTLILKQQINQIWYDCVWVSISQKKTTLTSIVQNKHYSQVFHVFQFTESIGWHIRQFVAVQVPELTRRKKRHKKLNCISSLFVRFFSLSYQVSLVATNLSANMVSSYTINDPLPQVSYKNDGDACRKLWKEPALKLSLWRMGHVQVVFQKEVFQSVLCFLSLQSKICHLIVLWPLQMWNFHAKPS